MIEPAVFQGDFTVRQSFAPAVAGTKSIVPFNPRRTSLILAMSNTGFAVSVSVNGDMTGSIKLDSVVILPMTFANYGILPTMEWFANYGIGASVSITEIIYNPRSD